MGIGILEIAVLFAVLGVAALGVVGVVLGIVTLSRRKER